MHNYDQLKNELIDLTHEFAALLERAGATNGLAKASLEKSLASCNTIKQQMTEDTIRVAVVGPIKSGKSTFANAILGGDYLKRGAGVVTSFVTRVHSGEGLKAELQFKSWDEINADIEHALVLFPSLDWPPEGNGFDIRQADGREALQQALASLNPEQLLSRDARNANSVLLSSYLNGYDRVREIISSSHESIWFASERFAEHRDFAGDDALAVYLKDIRLEIRSPHLKRNVELADCQGSDSPNPLHLAMIQDYLLQTHLLVYVISSRTGLRRADIRFLSIIKKMGIIDSMLFILNADFSEHESLEDLQQLERKVADELALLRPAPEIYTLSALLNLFRANPDDLTEKDRQRLAQWEQDTSLRDYSDRETERFLADFQAKLINESLVLLLRNHVERLLVMTADLNAMVGVKRELLLADGDKAVEIVAKIMRNQDQMGRIRAVIKNTLEGSIRKIRKELRSEVDRFFDPRSAELMRSLVDFIRNYRVPSWQEHLQGLSSSGFANTLYHVYQEFKQALDGYIAETINPAIFHFVREREQRIVDYMHDVAGPYGAMVQDAVSDFRATAEELGIPCPVDSPNQQATLPGLETIRQASCLKLPSASTSMRYSAKVKTEAIIHLGAYKILRGFRKLIRKPLAGDRQEEIKALKAGVERLKKETERSILFHFKDYRENIKFRYIFQMVESAATQISDTLLDRFQTYEDDLTQMAELIDANQADKSNRADALREFSAGTDLIYQRAQRLRDAVLPH
ncbi:MAG: dynamin family protein [Desulfobacterales bacterium]|jgi:GTPase SAR1 family protein